MNRTVKFILIGIGIAILCIVGFGLFIGLFQYLWNWLVPSIIGWRAITYWEALGLFILSKMLFKGITWNNNRGGHWNRHWKAKWNEKWNAKWREKWDTMSPEDRERFKQKMRDKCGWMTAPPESNQPNNQ
jgi:hypothetical protein